MGGCFSSILKVSEDLGSSAVSLFVSGSASFIAQSVAEIVSDGFSLHNDILLQHCLSTAPAM